MMTPNNPEDDYIDWLELTYAPPTELDIQIMYMDYIDGLKKTGDD